MALLVKRWDFHSCVYHIEKVVFNEISFLHNIYFINCQCTSKTALKYCKYSSHTVCNCFKVWTFNYVWNSLCLSTESVSCAVWDAVCPVVIRRHELELPDTSAGGDPAPLHVGGETLAHYASCLPHRTDCGGRRVHILRWAEQVCLQLGPTRMWERLLRCLRAALARAILGLSDHPVRHALSALYGLRGQ